MSNRNIENGLAVAGAILVLVGVLFAAASALADETNGVTATGIAIHGAAETSVETAATAHAEAAEAAAERMARNNELDLDIRFFDRMSNRVAKR